jgi:hypothetical protein
MRLAAAIGVIAIAFAAAVYVHQRSRFSTVVVTHASGDPYVGSGNDPYSGSNENDPYSGKAGTDPYSGLPTGKQAVTKTVRDHPSWEDPAAVLLSIGGVAVATGILAYRRPQRSGKPS